MDTRKLESSGHNFAFDGERQEHGVQGYVNTPDLAAEIVKRWNAYPTLVALLRELVQWEQNPEHHVNPARPDKFAGDLANIGNEAHAYLVELGEIQYENANAEQPEDTTGQSSGR